MVVFRRNVEVVSKTEIDATLTSGTVVPLGYIGIHRYGGSYEAFEVYARQRGTAGTPKAYWNIRIAGKPIFKSKQSVGELNADKKFIPDADGRYGAASAARVELVMAASGAEGSKLDIAVLVRRV